MRRRALLLVFATVAVGCEAPNEPLEPVWGKQPCAHCAMLVSQRDTAAQLTTDGGERFFFDDPGCMVAYIAQRNPKVRSMWVHLASQWVDPKVARYRRGGATPMDFGFIPSADGEASYADLERVVLQRNEKEAVR